MEATRVSKKLLKKYYQILIIYTALLLFTYLLVHVFKVVQINGVDKKMFGQVLVIISGVIGLSLPIFWRVLFIYNIKDKKQIDSKLFLNFEKNIMFLALSTPFFLILALLFDLNQKSIIVLTLFSLYSIYYYYPGTKKMSSEMRIFRIKSL